MPSSSISSKRKWIIIEDSVAKPEGIIPYILKYYPGEEICWIYPHHKDYPSPTLFKVEFYEKLIPYKISNIDQEHFRIEELGITTVLNPPLRFYWCTNKDTLLEAFEQCISDHAVLFLDIELGALGLKSGVTPAIKLIVDRFIEKDKTLISLITNQHNPPNVVIELGYDGNDRIIAKSYAFGGQSEEKDYKDLIEDTHFNWNALFTMESSIEHFLKNVAPYSSGHFHNWDATINKTKDGKPLLDKDWRIPVQLRWLIEALNYSKDDFLDTFEWKDMQQSRAIGECLKGMGTSDTNGVSLLAALLITWMAFRRIFNADKISNFDGINQQFVEVIKAVDKQTDNRMISRLSLISPPQNASTYQKTATTLYEMMLKLLRNKTTGDCTLHKVQLNEKGLRFDFLIPFHLLARKVGNQYRHKFIEQNTAQKGGDTSEKIIEFYRWSNYYSGDLNSQDNKPFLGSKFGLKIFPKGEDEIVLKFG